MLGIWTGQVLAYANFKIDGTINMLILERRELHLRSFSEGNFSHWVIPAERAKSLIDEAIATEQHYATYLHDNSNTNGVENEFLEFLQVLQGHCNLSLWQ